MSESTPTPGHVDAAEIVIFETDNGWSWSARDTNGEEVATSGDDAYTERSRAESAARDLFPDAEIQDAF